MHIIIRPFASPDLPAMNAIWNEVVEDGIAFPQEECLTAASGAAFFSGQTHAAVAEETKVDTKQVRVLSFREIKKSPLEQYLADNHIVYHKYQLEDAKQ